MDTKICTVCGLEKQVDQFNFKNIAKNKRSSECKQCHKEYNNKWYESNKESIKKRIRNNNKIYSSFFQNLKESNPCIDCGIKYPYYVMDFDHLRDKEFNVAKAIATGMSKKLILKEIEKCELVCANCHRIRTHKRNQY